MDIFSNRKFDLLRFLILVIVLSGMVTKSFGQIKVGNNPGIIDPTSILELESDSLVMVLPRMTTTDRSAISNPYPGAMIFNTTSSCIEVNVGSKATPDWQCLADDDDISSTGLNTDFEISGDQDSLRIVDDGGVLGVLISDLVSALNNTGGILSDSTLDVNWSDISGMPSDMQNNDQYIISSSNYDAANQELDVVMSNGGTSFSISLSALARDVDVTSEIADTATALRALINANDANDLDTDPTNEYNTDLSINGTGTDDSLTVTDTGGSESVDLGTIVTAMDDDGLATDSQLADTASVLRTYINTEVAASSGTDGDQVTGNEYNTAFNITGSGTNDNLSVIDPGGTESVDLGTLVIAMDDDGLATDADVTTEIGDTSTVLRNLISASDANDLDMDPTNEHNTGMSLSTTTVQVSDGGGTVSVDLNPTFATDADVTTEIGDTATVLRNLIDANAASDLDTDPNNEHNTDLSINGSGTEDSLSVTDSGGTESVDLGALVNAMDDDGLATDTDVTSEIGDTAAVLRTYADNNDNFLGKLDQTLQGNREIITSGNNLRISGSGQVGIGDVAIPANSKLFVDGLISSSSDRRLKTDIKRSAYGLDEILKLNAVSYTWIDTKKAQMEGKQLGFIAQEVRDVLPELVRGEESENSYLSMTYDRFAPVLVNAIKELHAELEAIKNELVNSIAENDQLKSSIKKQELDFEFLKAEIDQIKNMLSTKIIEDQNTLSRD